MAKHKTIPDRELLTHIQELGLKTVEDYRDWCVRNGFSRKLDKHWKLRCRERYIAHQAAADQRLKRKKRESRNQLDVLRAVCAGNVSADEVTQPHLKRLCDSLRTGNDGRHEPPIKRQPLERLLTHLHECRARLFEGFPALDLLGQRAGNTYIEALALIAAHYRAWQRPLQHWKPRSHSPARQFASLLRHLFVQYDMPDFFDRVWFTGRDRQACAHRRWYLHVGLGRNIRRCELPLPLTKKMAHHFMRAPEHVSVPHALRWGQVLGLGGDRGLAQAILGTRLANHFEHDDFWTSVIRWFAAHRQLDRTQIGPIVDYLHFQRFPRERVPGMRDTIPAPQPNLTMKGRSPASLLKRVNEWHRALARENHVQVGQWQPQEIASFELFEGSQVNGTLKCWTIRELLSSSALRAEGRKLKHCVATYAPVCARGESSIWTLELETFEGTTKCVTIEVRNSARQICQIRGKTNRLPTTQERRIIQRWAEKSGLGFGPAV